MMLQRVKYGESSFSPYDALDCGTMGGARVLGRDDIGMIREGMAADIIGFELKQLPFAGGLHDPVASVVLCGPVNVDMSIINGRLRVMDGSIQGVEIGSLIDRQNELAAEMMEKAMVRTGIDFMEH